MTSYGRRSERLLVAGYVVAGMAAVAMVVGFLASWLPAVYVSLILSIIAAGLFRKSQSAASRTIGRRD
jgi:membrane protein implicated in regulation of membrane protease activity